MFNRPALLMDSLSATPQACFSLRIPWLYNDEDYCGNPRHEGGTPTVQGQSVPAEAASIWNFWTQTEKQ